MQNVFYAHSTVEVIDLDKIDDKWSVSRSLSYIVYAKLQLLSKFWVFTMWSVGMLMKDYLCTYSCFPDTTLKIASLELEAMRLIWLNVGQKLEAYF